MTQTAHQRQLERELLGAEKMTFGSVYKAVGWYARATMDPDKRLALSMLPDSRGVSTPGYLAARDLTCAAIANSLKGLNYAELFVEWCSTDRSQEDLAKDEGFPSVYALKMTMRRTEDLLEPRLRERGVLE
jgi:hypothetical protein